MLSTRRIGFGSRFTFYGWTLQEWLGGMETRLFPASLRMYSPPPFNVLLSGSDELTLVHDPENPRRPLALSLTSTNYPPKLGSLLVQSGSVNLQITLTAMTKAFSFLTLISKLPGLLRFPVPPQRYRLNQRSLHHALHIWMFQQTSRRLRSPCLEELRQMMLMIRKWIRLSFAKLNQRLSGKLHSQNQHRIPYHPNLLNLPPLRGNNSATSSYYPFELQSLLSTSLRLFVVSHHPNTSPGMKTDPSSHQSNPGRIAPSTLP